ncbi:60S ribosomal protein L21A [Glugoides intestinalis]
MRSNGFRRGTRRIMKKDFGTKGMPSLTKVLQRFHIGDFVDCKIDSSVVKGMPHKYYHGRTGIVYNVNPRSYGVIFYKKVGGKYIERVMHIRPEHLTLSRSTEDMKNRQKVFSEKLKEAQKTGLKVFKDKVLPAGPRPAFTVSLQNNTPIEVSAKPYTPFF